MKQCSLSSLVGAQFYPSGRILPAQYPTKVGPQLAPLSSKGCQITMLKATLKGRAHTEHQHHTNTCRNQSLTSAEIFVKTYLSNQDEEAHLVPRYSPIVRRGWIDILFKSGPPHLQIIHTLLPGAVPSLPHPRLPCHTQNRGSAQIGLFFQVIRTLLEPMILVLAKSRQQQQRQ